MSDALPLADDLGRINARLQTLIRGQLTAGGVSLAAARTLSTLEREGPQRLTELAAVEQVTQPSMSALVARLEANRLVRRDGNVSDRRVVVVSITDEGTQMLESIVGRRSQLLAARVAALPEADQAAIRQAIPALDRLVELMQERNPVGQPG